MEDLFVAGYSDAKVHDYRVVWIQQQTFLPEPVLQGISTLTKVIKYVERRDRQLGVQLRVVCILMETDSNTVG
jgi:hypothetical protein